MYVTSDPHAAIQKLTDEKCTRVDDDENHAELSVTSAAAAETRNDNDAHQCAASNDSIYRRIRSSEPVFNPGLAVLGCSHDGTFGRGEAFQLFRDLP
jgi:hypothetical protein